LGSLTAFRPAQAEITLGAENITVKACDRLLRCWHGIGFATIHERENEPTARAIMAIVVGILALRPLAVFSDNNS
jgi:hypothetical protein